MANVLLYKIGFPEAAVIDRIVAQRAKAGLYFALLVLPSSCWCFAFQLQVLSAESCRLLRYDASGYEGHEEVSASFRYFGDSVWCAEVGVPSSRPAGGFAALRCGYPKK